jgi:hypothetical protein
MKITTAGMRNQRLIWAMLAIATRITIGPSSESISAKTRLLSITPKSFENLFTRIPEGVESKKLPGLRTMASIIFSWMLVLAISSDMLSVKYLAVSTRKYPMIRIERVPQ